MVGGVLNKDKERDSRGRLVGIALGRGRFSPVESLKRKDIDVALRDPAQRKTEIRYSVCGTKLVRAEILADTTTRS